MKTYRGDWVESTFNSFEKLHEAGYKLIGIKNNCAIMVSRLGYIETFKEGK